MKKTIQFQLIALAFACFNTAVSGAVAPTVLKTVDKKIVFLTKANPGRVKIEGMAKSEDPSAISVESVLQGEFLTIKTVLEMNSLDTGIELRNKHMKETYLETAKFPKSEFEMEPLKISDGNEQKFKGTLTIHGKTIPVSGVVELKNSEKEIEVALHSTVKMTDFGIQQPQFMAIKVEDEVALDMTFRGVK
jgi:hypothetical protein